MGKIISLVSENSILTAQNRDLTVATIVKKRKLGEAMSHISFFS